MDRVYNYLKTYKLNKCCCFTIRTGLLLVGYFNIIYDIAAIAAITEVSYPPVVQQVATSIAADDVPISILTLCYVTELGFNVVLLCAVYGSDVYLLKTYMNCCFGVLVTSVLFYSLVIASIDLLMKFAIIFSILFDMYVILLVRTAILNVKEENGELPTLVTSYTLPSKDQDIEEQPSQKPSSGICESKSETQKV